MSHEIETLRAQCLQASQEWDNYANFLEERSIKLKLTQSLQEWNVAYSVLQERNTRNNLKTSYTEWGNYISFHEDKEHISSLPNIVYSTPDSSYSERFTRKPNVPTTLKPQHNTRIVVTHDTSINSPPSTICIQNIIENRKHANFTRRYCFGSLPPSVIRSL